MTKINLISVSHIGRVSVFAALALCGVLLSGCGGGASETAPVPKVEQSGDFGGAIVGKVARNGVAGT